MRLRTPVLLLALGTALLAGIAAVCLPALATPTVVPPPVGARFDAQLGGSYPPPPGVRVVERDWHSVAAAGLYSICYVDAYQTQPEAEAFWTGSRASLLLRHAGERVEDPHWPGQYLLDTSTAQKRDAIAAVVTTAIDRCAHQHFQAVDLDNLDSWTRSHGLLTAADNLALAQVLVARAHALGLAVAQKNAPVLGASGRSAAGFDFAIAESCERYSQCADYTKTYGRHVIDIEYSDDGRADFAAACAARGRSISIEYRDRLVVPLGRSGYTAAWC